MPYQVPHYATVGVCILFRRADGAIFGMPVAVDEIGEGGIEGVITALVEAAAGRGLSPLSEEEYVAWARELASQHQQKQLAAAMQESTRFRAIDPKRIDAILAAHKGAPGGDA